MRRYTLSECSTLFGVDPKTFRLWLSRDKIEPQTSRADPRIKYLTDEQVQRLSRLHDHPLGTGEPAAPEVISPTSYKLLIEQVAEVERGVTALTAMSQQLPRLITDVAALGERGDAVDQQMQAIATAMTDSQSALMALQETLTDAVAHTAETDRQGREQLRTDLQQILDARDETIQRHLANVGNTIAAHQQAQHQLEQQTAKLAQQHTEQGQTVQAMRQTLTTVERQAQAADHQLAQLAHDQRDQAETLTALSVRAEQIATDGAQRTDELGRQLAQLERDQARDVADMSKRIDTIEASGQQLVAQVAQIAVGVEATRRNEVNVQLRVDSQAREIEELKQALQAEREARAQEQKALLAQMQTLMDARKDQATIAPASRRRKISAE